MLSDLADISGPWGVVLWDPRTGDHLIVADPVGVQPVYWARTATGSFAVASWLDKLLDRPDVDDSLDYEGVLLDSIFGLHGETIAHRTRFAAVSRVPWGRAVRVRPDGSTRIEQYWDPRNLPGPDRSLTLHDAAELLRERIDTAVRRLTPTDVSVGAHVSGGLDCTTVACRANQILGEAGGSLTAGYSWAPDENEVPRLDGDERSLIDDVTAQEHFPVRTLTQDESGDWFFELDRDRYPQTTHARERFVLPKARADGVSVMLSGWGGDELASFNGRNVLRHLTRHGHLVEVWKQTGERIRLLATGPVGVRDQARSFAATLLDATPPWFPDPRHRAERREQAALDAEIDRELRALSPLAADARRERERTFERAGDHHQFQLELLVGGHLQRRCEGWYQTGRLFDIDYRYPLLDLGVVEAALSLPWQAFYSEGWTRTAFRLAVQPWVPPSVAWNVTKSEPASFAPASGAVRPRPATVQPWRPDDEKYGYIVDLAWRTATAGFGAPRPSQPVHARADAAPQQR